MTVIAWDGKILAADGRITKDGELICDNYVKLHEVKHAKLGKVVTGFCGALPALGPWLEHLETDGFGPLELMYPGDDEGMISMSALSVTRKGKCFEHDSFGGWFEITNPAALGSGSTIAQHYLKQGVDAVTAIRETCKSNISCGGNIMAYDFTDHTFTAYTV